MATPWKDIKHRRELISEISGAIQQRAISFVDHGEGLFVGEYVTKSRYIITLRRIDGKVYGRSGSMYLTNDGCSSYILQVQSDGKIVFTREDDDNRYVVGEDPRLPVDLYDLVSTDKLRYRG